jgi:RING finger protein 170
LVEEKEKLENLGLEANIEELREDKAKLENLGLEANKEELREDKGKSEKLGLEAEIEEKGKLKEGPPSKFVCSKCHVKFQIICQATCSHWFCGTCTMVDWEQSPDIEPCKCPQCHRPITLLVPTENNNYYDYGNKYRHDPEVLIGIQTYNCIFSDQSKAPITQRLLDLPFLLRTLFKDFVEPNTSLPFLFRARVFVTMILIVIYILSPIDIISEGIFGIVGLLDDLIITLIFFLHVAALYRSILCLRHGRNFRFE